jgi:tRNA (guanine-N7-)-methyltransferase
MAVTERAEASRPRTFYGRRRGKALSPAQRRRLETVLPAVRLDAASLEENPERRLVDLPAILPRAAGFWLEIGFGGGEHLHALARAHPKIGVLGCEPFVNGVAMLLGKIAEDDPGNILIHPGEARDLLEVLPEGALGRVYLLYPDPWPKARHLKRRFMNAAGLAPLARAMESGAELRLATDIADYAEHAVVEAEASGAFEPVTVAEPAWRRPWGGWSGTRYEAKALREGRAPHYLVWRRR